MKKLPSKQNEVMVCSPLCEAKTWLAPPKIMYLAAKFSFYKLCEI